MCCRCPGGRRRRRQGLQAATAMTTTLIERHNRTMNARRFSDNSSCADACVRMGVNYSATYGTVQHHLTTPMQSLQQPRCAADTPALSPTTQHAGSLMNDFTGGRRKSLFIRLSDSVAVHFVHSNLYIYRIGYSYVYSRHDTVRPSLQ